MPVFKYKGYQGDGQVRSGVQGEGELGLRVESRLDRHLGRCRSKRGDVEESLLQVLVQLESPVDVDVVEGHQRPQVVCGEGHQRGGHELARAPGCTPRPRLGRARLELSPDLGDALGVGREEVGELAGHCPAECTRARSEWL